MIDNFLGIDTEGGTLDTGFCHRMWHAVMIFFLKDRSSLQYFITQGMGQSSMFLTFRTLNFKGRTSALGRVVGGKGGIPGRLHTCLLRSLLKNTTCS